MWKLFYYLTLGIYFDFLYGLVKNNKLYKWVLWVEVGVELAFIFLSLHL